MHLEQNHWHAELTASIKNDWEGWLAKALVEPAGTAAHKLVKNMTGGAKLAP